MEKIANAKRLQKRAEKLKQEMRAAGENTWRNFTVCDGCVIVVG